MQMRPDIQIQSMLKAMSDTILPALDPNNKLAQEQARLLMGMLMLMAKHLPLQFRFDCDELGRLVRFCADLQAAVGAVHGDLAGQAAAGAAVLARAKAEPVEVEQMVKALRATTSETISRVFAEADTATQDRVQKVVLAMTAEQIPRDRAWVITQNWEPDPKAVPDIESLLPVIK